MSHISDPEGQLLKQLYLIKGGSQPVLDGVNYFYNYGIHKIVTSIQIRTYNGLIGSFTKVYLEKPMKGNQPLWPYEARRSDLSYMARMYADFEINGTSAKVYLGKIPVIVQSQLCWLYGLTELERYERGEPEKDPGAYSIIKGLEKILLIIENLRASEIFLYENKGEYVVRYTSQSLTFTSINTIKEKDGIVKFSFSRMKDNTINVFNIFYLLGLSNNTVESSLREIENFIIDDDPQRQERRRREMRYYMKATENDFDDNQVTIYNKFADTLFDKEILLSPDRNTLLYRLALFEIFQNLTVKSNDVKELERMITSKIRLLASMVAKFVEFQNGYLEPDDRDSWGRKQLADTGIHLARAFNRIWSKMISGREGKGGGLADKFIKKGYQDAQKIASLINTNFLAEEFVFSYNKNLFGVGEGKNQREVVIVDNLDRDNLLAAIAHTRRISVPTNKMAKIREKRLIHNSQWGIACPAFTPEGESCGLSKDAAVTTYISLERDENYIRRFLNEPIILEGAKIVDGKIRYQDNFYAMKPNAIETSKGVEFHNYSINPSGIYKYPLYLNGNPIGFCDSVNLRKDFLLLRRKNLEYFDMGILLNDRKELKIFTNSGRVCRPLLVVDYDSQQLVIDNKNLRGTDMSVMIKEGALEYIDVIEQEQVLMLIAEDSRILKTFRDDYIKTYNQYIELSNTPNVPEKQLADSLLAVQDLQNKMRYTHCEIDPTAILGISAISMPFIEFNQGPRVTYQSSMVRQSLGGPSIRNELRFDNTMKTILEPGVPIITTDAHEFLGLDLYPSGRQLIIAITTYGGSNQEDAITFNQAGVDLGLFLMMIYHSYKTTVCQDRAGVQERIEIPPNNDPRKYSKLENGIIKVNEAVYNGDCLIAKVIKDSSGNITDDSVYVEFGKEGIVDEVYESVNADGCKIIKVRIRELRKLQAGDKLASRYAQKGTIGEILPEKDFPWIVSDNPALDGIKPNVIFNPHGIPSRMTMGKLYEIFVGNVTAMTGDRFNATAFRRFGQPGEKNNIDEFKMRLEEMGFTKDNKARLVSGITGIEIDADIYVGTIYYQLLRHLVKDKMNARGTGKVNFLTRQPISGMRRAGATRVGKLYCLCM